MIITPQALRGIYTAFNTVFNKAFEGQHPTYEKVATVVPSTSESETYAWLGDIPGMREWIGEREIQNLSGSAYTIKNKDFELTVGVDRNAVEDDKIGLYNPSIQMLGESAALHPDELVYGLLANGFTEKCYDGKAFFATDHPVGKDKASNKGTAKLSMDTYAHGLTLAGDAPAEAMNKSLQQVQGALDRKPEKKVDLGGGKKDKDESSDEGGSGKGKQVIIHKLLVPVDLKKIKDLQQLLALLQEVEDYAAANEDGEPGDDEDAVPAPA